MRVLCIALRRGPFSVGQYASGTKDYKEADQGIGQMLGRRSRKERFQPCVVEEWIPDLLLNTLLPEPWNDSVPLSV